MFQLRSASVYEARSPRTRRLAGSGNAGSADPSSRAHRGGTWSRAESRRCANGDTCRTALVVGRSRCGGEGGIRTHEVFRLCAFQERRHQPLGHLSDLRIPGSGPRPESSPPADRRGGPVENANGVGMLPESRELNDHELRAGSHPDLETRGIRSFGGLQTGGVEAAAVIMSRPIYGRRTSGTSTEPSGRWYVSSSAATVRANASPDPLSVCTSSGFAPASGR
jgi:hypothetical protein